jgi:hypothetical protein
MIKMKKKLILIICLAIVFAGAMAVAYASGIFNKQEIYNEKEERYEMIEDYQNYINSTKETDAAKPLENIRVYYSEDLLHKNDCDIFLGRDAGYYSRYSTNTRRDFTKVILAAFPTNAIREISQTGDVYAVYDTDIGARVYLFFSKEKNNYMTLDGFPVIMQKKLEYKDFKEIQLGNSIGLVEKIDPVIPQYVKFFDTITDDFLKGYTEKGAPPTSVHLLTDGILKIEYDRVDGQYIITNMVYNKDFVLEGLDGKTCYKILDIDYVNNKE